MLVDSDYLSISNFHEADIIIVNTCGFLQAAKDESIATLQELAKQKRKGQLLIAVGCMVQRFGAEVTRHVPSLDGLIGTHAWADIVPFIKKLRDSSRKSKPIYHLPETGETPLDTVILKHNSRGALPTSAYLKISDGCSAPCAFCTIPSFKGSHRSRPREHVILEAQRLVHHGVKEIIIIAQDTTAYGRDFGEMNGLPSLLEDIAKSAHGIQWLRLMYAYPGHASKKLVDVMAQHQQILPYIDIPLQHGHPDTLKRMKRPHNIKKVLEWIEYYRKAMPQATIRTTFIVGYPGETETEFQGLVNFIEEVKFDRVGVFTFSPEPGTPAFDLPHQVDGEIKQARREQVMTIQQAISLQRNQYFMGKKLDVLVEGFGDGVSITRSYRDAPEIDGYIIIEDELPIGKIVPVFITGAMTYDLMAVPANKPLVYFPH